MIRLAILGRPYVSGPTGPVPVPAKAIGLLAYLALHPESQPRERVIELLWPERASLTGRKLLRNLLWRLRQDLVDEIVVAREDWLALGTTVWVDAREFIQTRQLTLYRGDLLDGIAVRDAPEFESWLMSERDRWRSTFVDIVERAITDKEAVDGWTEVESLARLGLLHAPLTESLHRDLMEALARLGRRAEAIHHYDTWRDFSYLQMALDPEPETQDLYRAIVEGKEPSSLPAASRGTYATSFDYALISDLPLLEIYAGCDDTSPYGRSLSPIQHLASGWKFARYGDVPEAQAAFEAAIAGFSSASDARGAAQAYGELALLALHSGRYDEASGWVAACDSLGEAVWSPALRRLRHCVIGLVNLQHSGNEALTATSTSFTAQLVPSLLAASRCELAHDLAVRGLLDDAARAAVDKLALQRR